jgi:hypothetical protein
MEPYEGASGKAGAMIHFYVRSSGYEDDYLVTYKMNGPSPEQVELGTR